MLTKYLTDLTDLTDLTFVVPNYANQERCAKTTDLGGINILHCRILQSFYSPGKLVNPGKITSLEQQHSWLQHVYDKRSFC